MTILFISHEDDKVMGSTLSLANMVHALQARGCRCVVTLPGYGAAHDYLTPRGIECIVAKYHVDFVGRGNRISQFVSFPYRFLRDWHDNRRAMQSICQQLAEKAIHVDIVHTNTAVIDFGPELARRLHVPHVWHLREFIDLDMGFRPFKGWHHLRHLIQASDATISITHAIARHYHVEDDGARDTHHKVFFDAVRSRADLLPSQKKEPVFVFCGQLAPHKGPEMAIRAFCRFADTHPEYRLLLMGTATDADYERHLKDLVPEQHKTRVCFMGYVAHPDQVLASALALLMCSRNEAQGRVTIEAMLQGCVVIALNAGGTRELVSHRQTGLLFDDEKEIPALMSEIVNGDEEPTLTAEAWTITENARQFATDNFMEESYAERLIRLYDTLQQAQ